MLAALLALSHSHGALYEDCIAAPRFVDTLPFRALRTYRQAKTTFEQSYGQAALYDSTASYDALKKSQPQQWQLLWTKHAFLIFFGIHSELQKGIHSELQKILPVRTLPCSTHVA